MATITVSATYEGILISGIPTPEYLRKLEHDKWENVAKENKRKEEERKQRISVEAKNAFPLLVKAIEESARNGNDTLEHTWTYKDSTFYGIPIEDYEEVMKILAPIFEAVGYKVNSTIYYYSNSWQKKSGKIGYQYAIIDWRK